MEQKKKLFKYYAIRIGGSVVFRRTVSKINKVKSTLYKPGTEFRLEQVTYSGGQPVGCMAYNDWISHGGGRIGLTGYLRVSREQFRAMRPYIN